MFQSEKIKLVSSCSNWMGKVPKKQLALSLALLVTALLAITGCQTQAPKFPTDLSEQTTNTTTTTTTTTNHTETIILREGDVVKITFPSAPNLSTSQPIRRDGNIVLQLVGEVKAAGKTPTELKDELLKLYAGQIESKEVSVELMSSSFPVFVTGAVLRPAKVMSDHPMTALEAIMECGGFDYVKANLKSVKVLRQDGAQLKSFTVNLKTVMQGKEAVQFYLKPADIIYVPEKFTWF